MKNLIRNTVKNTGSNTDINTRNSRTFSKTIISVVIMTALVTTPSFAATEEMSIKQSPTEKAEQQKTNENIGFGSGFVIGAVVGGPIGAIVAGIGGYFIANHVNAKDDIEDLELSLTAQDNLHQQALESASENYQQKLQHVEQGYQNELLALEQYQDKNEHIATNTLNAEKLLMSLQFRTGSSEIAPHYQEQVAALAEILNNSPSLKIDLSGYTDLTGEAEVNQALSLARVDAVKALLMAQGVDDLQITTFAYGAGAPVVANIDEKVSFYDRRVVMKLHNKAPVSQTAQNF